jgi:hypothetical protein
VLVVGHSHAPFAYIPPATWIADPITVGTVDITPRAVVCPGSVVDLERVPATICLVDLAASSCTWHIVPTRGRSDCPRRDEPGPMNWAEAKRQIDPQERVRGIDSSPTVRQLAPKPVDSAGSHGTSVDGAERSWEPQHEWVRADIPPARLGSRSVGSDPREPNARQRSS